MSVCLYLCMYVCAKAYVHIYTVFYIIKFLSIKFRRSLAEASRARLLQRLLQMASAEASAEASADGCFTGGAKQHRGWNWFRMNFETLHTDQVKINDLALQNYAKHFENEFKVHSVSMKFHWECVKLYAKSLLEINRRSISKCIPNAIE